MVRSLAGMLDTSHKSMGVELPLAGPRSEILQWFNETSLMVRETAPTDKGQSICLRWQGVPIEENRLALHTLIGDAVS